jgi:hypothetical protein
MNDNLDLPPRKLKCYDALSWPLRGSAEDLWWGERLIRPSPHIDVVPKYKSPYHEVYTELHRFKSNYQRTET